MMTPFELYSRKPKIITSDLNYVCTSCYNHFPEIENLPDFINDIKDGLIKLHIYEDHIFDHRRSWTLAGVYFEDTPFMIIQNAGREGADHIRRVVTNVWSYRNAVMWLRLCVANLQYKVPFDDEVVNQYENIENLDCFYGYCLGGHFDNW